MTQSRIDGKRIRAAIIGGGGIAEVHAQILKGIPQVQLVAICDSAPGKAAAFASKNGNPESYTTIGEMLGRAKLDAVHICTPPVAHAANAVECLQGGVDVFVEKPFCVSTNECDEVARAAARSGRAVGVNHNLLFHPSILRMVEAIQQRRLGALEHVAVCYNMPMPVASGPYTHWLFRGTKSLVLELAPHPLSIIERLMGAVVSSQSLPCGEMRLPSGVRFFPTWQTIMQCERGTASLYLSVGGGYLNTSVRVEAEDGAVHVDLRRNTLQISQKSHLMRPNDDLREGLRAAVSLVRDGFKNFKDYVFSSIGRPVPYPASYAAMNGSIRAFHGALLAGVMPPVGLTQGINVVQACEAVTAPVADTPLVHHAA